MSTASQVSKLYRTVVEDVINNVKDAFLDEGVDEQVLQELKQLWEGKLSTSKALEPPPADRETVLQSQNVAMMLPQPIQSSTQQEQGAGAQGGQIQATTQYQLTPAAATATLALPSGIFQQQLAALGAGGQIQNITVQQTGTGQYITLAGIPPQQIQQLQQQQQRQQQPQLGQHIAPQMLQQQQQHQIRIPQQQHQQQIRIAQQQQTLQQQQPKLMPAGQVLQQNQTTVPSQVNKSQGGIHQSLIQLDGNGDTSSSEDEFDDDDKEEEDKEEENDEEEQGEEEDPLNTDDDVSEDDPSDLFDTDNVVVCQYDKINRNKNKWKFHLKDGIMNLNGRDFVFQKATGDSEW